MIRNLKILLINAIVLFGNQLVAHGFGAHTMVKLLRSSTEEWQAIKQIDDRTVSLNLKAKSYRTVNNVWSYQAVKVVGFSEANCYIRIRVDQSIINVIECTPSQEFYEIKLERWMPACQLHAGNHLLRDNTDGSGESIEIVDVELIARSLPVFIIEVANTHTFLVTGLSVLTHNDVLTPTLFYALGQSVFGSSVSGATVGSAIGPLGTLGGFVIGGIVAVGVTYCFGDWSRTWYKLRYDIGQVLKIFKLNKTNDSKSVEEKKEKADDDAQAPGKPTEEDGFVPKKGWDGKKVKHRRGYGWPDKNGNVWIPTGPKGHGGPHWDVQKPGGGYENIVPGGRIRGK
mgnify:FL=1